MNVGSAFGTVAQADVPPAADVLLLVLLLPLFLGLAWGGQRRGWWWCLPTAAVAAAVLAGPDKPLRAAACLAAALLATATLWNYQGWPHRSPPLALLGALGVSVAILAAADRMPVATPGLSTGLAVGLAACVANLAASRWTTGAHPVFRALYLGLLGLTTAAALWMLGAADTGDSVLPLVLVLWAPPLVDGYLSERDRSFGLDLHHGRVAALLIALLVTVATSA